MELDGRGTVFNLPRLRTFTLHERDTNTFTIITEPREMLSVGGRGLKAFITKLLAAAILILGTYLLLFEKSSQFNIDEIRIDHSSVEQALEQAHQIQYMTYEPPGANPLVNAKDADVQEDSLVEENEQRRRTAISHTMKYHKLWSWANAVINIHELFPDTPDVDSVLEAMRLARIVYADVLDIGEYESGTSEKWILVLEGGQKAVMKIAWEAKGRSKEGALCNYGYEMPHGEIAAFHLHKLLGMRNTPYVAGRKVDLAKEILPVASPAVARQISTKGNETCVTGKCFFCKTSLTLCPTDGLVEASIAYWIPRHLKLYTSPPDYMPFSTPRMEKWQQYGINNRTYCDTIRKEHPYEIDRYYHDLFDFAVVDSLMYHYDSKHYLIHDKSEAHGLTVRLDHGRAFCYYDRDEDHVFLVPIKQCCMLRWATHDSLMSLRSGLLAKKLREELARDALAPVLDEQFYSALTRRLNRIVNMVDRCAKRNGGYEHILVG